MSGACLSPRKIARLILTPTICPLYFRPTRIGGERGSICVYKPTVERDLQHVSGDEPRIVNTDPVTGQNLEMTVSEMDAPTHEGAKALLAYWSDCCREGDFVMGRHVPARAITRLMKNLNVMEPVGSGKDFRFRLVGSELHLQRRRRPHPDAKACGHHALRLLL